MAKKQIKQRKSKRNASQNKRNLLTKSFHGKTLLTLSLIIIGIFFVVFVNSGNPTFTAFINTTDVRTNNTYVNLTFNWQSISGVGTSNITGQIYENVSGTPKGIFVAHYTFNTNQSDVYDYSGYVNGSGKTHNLTSDVLNRNVTWRSATGAYPFNNCLTDGGGCYNFTPNPVALNTELRVSGSLDNTSNLAIFGNLTIMGWFNLAQDKTNSLVIMGCETCGSNSNSEDNNFIYILRGTGTGSLNYRHQYGSSNAGAPNPKLTFSLQTANNVYAYNKMYHFAVVREYTNATAGTVTLYINGTSITSSDFVLPPTNNGTGIKFQVGISNILNSLNGTADEIIISDKAFNPSQIIIAYRDGINNKSFSILDSSLTHVDRSYFASLYVSNTSDLGAMTNTSSIIILNQSISPLTINFSNYRKDISIYYGVNEKDNWESFSNLTAGQNNHQILQYHRDIGTNFVRLWIRHNTSSETFLETMPYKNLGTFIQYNYTDLDTMVNAILNISSNTKPFITFQYAPKNLSRAGISNENSDPINDTDYANYVSNVTKHLSTKHNISTWYFSIWNEPDCNSGSNFTQMVTNVTRYIQMYNTTYNETKDNNPEAKIGGAEFCTNIRPVDINSATWTIQDRKLATFLSNISSAGLSIDFISFHHYGGTSDSGFSGNRLNDTRQQYYTIINNIEYIKNLYYPNIPFFETEWNSRGTSNNDLLTSFNGAFVGSALLWMVQTNLTGEFYFQTTGDDAVSGDLGMWSQQLSDGFKYRPSYEVKRDFVKFNSNRSKIYNTTSPDSNIEILAVKNSSTNRKFITLINKYDEDYANINITIQDSSSNRNLVDLNTSISYSLINGVTQIQKLYSYQVMFLELNNTPSSISILNSPVNNTYFNDNTPQFFINNSDDADSDKIYYRLEISTDFSFTNTSYYNGTVQRLVNTTNGHNLSSSLNDGRYYWRTGSTDLASNSSYTEIRNFTIDATNPSITLNYPINNLGLQSGSITFKYTITDITLANSTLFIDNIPLKTNITITSAVEDIYTNSTLSDNYHNWYISARDLANNEVNSSIFSFTVTTTIESPSGGSTSGGAGAEQIQPVNQTNETTPLLPVEELPSGIPNAIKEAIEDIKKSTPESVQVFLTEQKILLLLIATALLYLGVIQRKIRKKKIAILPSILSLSLFVFTLKPEVSNYLTKDLPNLFNQFIQKIFPNISINTSLIVIIFLILIITSFIITIKKRKI